MELLWMITPQHTGTHFVKFFLELHPEINYWVIGADTFGKKTVHDLQTDYFKGRISKHKFVNTVLSLKPNQISYSQELYEKLKIKAVEKKPRYFLLHSHGEEFLTPGDNITYNDGIRRIICIRDPLLAVISALRRTNVGDTVAHRIIRIFHFITKAKWEAESFKYCIDLPNNKDKLHLLLRWLRLPLTEECKCYINQWPVVNETADFSVRVDENKEEVPTDVLEQLKIAKELVLKNELHSLLTHWVEELKSPKLQHYFENLGYDNLLWFG